MKNLYYIIILITVGCTNSQNSSPGNSDRIPQSKAVSPQQAVPDSLHDYRSYYYMSNLPTRKFAELYLKDSIMTNDYKGLYDCLDSLSMTDKGVRDFYFKVLLNALRKPEIVFIEQMGVFLVKNIDRFQDEFPDRLLEMEDLEVKYYAQSIEFYLSMYSKKPDKGEKWIADLKVLELKSTPEQLKKLELFFAEIKKSRDSEKIQ